MSESAFAALKITQNNTMSLEEFRSRKVALITGVTGQDGSYLTEFLLDKGYEVHGIIRRSSLSTLVVLNISTKTDMIKFFLHHGDLTDSTCLVHIISQVQPTEVYNLAAQSHVKVSFDMSEYTGDVDALASTSELYGKVVETPQKETTPFYPRSPYGVAKLYGYWIVVNYRESYSMYACNGILFNHESPRRGRTFVTRKISRAVADIHLGRQECLYLGNIDAKRDWGHARDYVEGMWLMLQQDEPEDFVLATGETHTVRSYIEKAFGVTGRKIVWEGEGVNEIGKDAETGKVRVRIDPKYFRPAEVELLLGDPTKAKEKLGWARKVTYDELVTEMVVADVQGGLNNDMNN
ncbi:unnamed protein product [Absidia cylindrospora]